MMTSNPARLLIVEDERIVAFDLKHKLESLGYTVVGTVAAGLDAVRDAEAMRPDLVLMDIHLEGEVDGIEAARGIAESFRIPVVFLTAYTTDDILARIQDGIAEGFVVKPYDVRTLHASIQAALARSRAARSRDTNTARIRAAMKAVRLGTWEWNAGTDSVMVSGAPADPLGQSFRRGGESFDDFLSRMHPDDRTDFRTWFRTARHAVARLSREFRYVRPDGGVSHILLEGQFERGSGDAIERFVGVVREIAADPS